MSKSFEEAGCSIAVVFPGGKRLDVNLFLLNQQDCWDQLEAIKELWFWRWCLHDLMKEAPREELKDYNELAMGLEHQLQYHWGFDENPDYIKWWDFPLCECPKMDNDDRYPYGCYIVSHDCPLHYLGLLINK